MRRLLATVALATLVGGLAGCAPPPASQPQGGAGGAATTQAPAGDAYGQSGQVGDYGQDYGQDYGASPQTTAPAGGGVVWVNVQGNSFPQITKVAVGQKVAWRNQGQAPHTVTADNGIFNGDLQPGGTYEWTAPRPGRVRYRCAYHPSMVGIVEIT